jgi:hypothetical protein
MKRRIFDDERHLQFVTKRMLASGGGGRMKRL